MITTTARRAVVLVAVQRLAEMAWAARNVRRLERRGAVESGRGHYPAMVALHGGWLAATAIESSRTPRTRPALLAAYLALQPLRYWVIRSLGDRWTTRILVVPGEPTVATGAFRWFRHPNYMVVAAEIALLPLALGARRSAPVFSLLNTLLMVVRIPAEQKALSNATESSSA